MMYIEGHWERVDTLQDVSKIIREYYNEELANEMDDLIEVQKESKYSDEYVNGLEEIIDSIRSLVY